MEKEIIAGALFLLTFISPPQATPPVPQLQIKKTTVVIPQIETKTVATNTREPLNDAQINFLGICESGMTANRNSGNGYYGAFQFSISTWNSMGTGYERADMAPLDVQISAVRRLLSRSSIWTQFPGCAVKMRATGLL